MRKVIFATLALLVAGCHGPFVPVQSIDKVGISTILAANNIKVASREEARSMNFVGKFSGYSCQNRAFVSEPASTKTGAIDQLKIVSVQNGATAITEPQCEEGGFSLIRNCYNSWECTASAYK